MNENMAAPQKDDKIRHPKVFRNEKKVLVVNKITQQAFE